MQGLYFDFGLFVNGDLLEYFSFLNQKLENMLFYTLYFNCILIFFWFVIHIVRKNIQLYEMGMIRILQQNIKYLTRLFALILRKWRDLDHC